MAENLFLVLTNPIEGEEDAFNKWYDAQHVPEVLDVPGVIAAQRYDLAEVTVSEDEDLPAIATAQTSLSRCLRTGSRTRPGHGGVPQARGDRPAIAGRDAGSQHDFPDRVDATG